MKKKLIIFDLDGTLLNTVADIACATNFALSELGYPTHTEATIQGFVGNGVSKLLERALPEEERSEPNVTRLRDIFTKYYDEHNADLSTPYHGILDVLSYFQECGLSLAVASNKYQSATEKLVSHYFADIHFSCVLGQRNGKPVKPDPQIVNEIIEHLNVSRDGVLYVGDSGVDMQTAHNAQVDAIGVSWGFRSRTELESYPHLAIVDRAEELKDLV